MACLSQKAAVISAVACGSLIAIFGITCLVLGVKGYFAFEDPCVDVKSFEIKDIDMESAEGGNAILNLLDSFTGGMASQFVPSQVTMEIEMTLEVNNTNPYSLDYEQGEEGIIAIPADEGDSPLENDLVVGSWQIPTSTLRAKASNDIPVTVTTTIDLLSADTMGLAGNFVSGKAFVFRIKGGIEGSSWVPGFTGTSNFLCLAYVDDIMDFESGTSIKCKHSTKVGRIISERGEINFEDLDGDDEVDPACFV